MSSPTTRFDKPITLSPLRSWLRAWRAVYNGMTLDEHLQFRLVHLLDEGRRSFHPLPSDISVVRGEIICTPNPDFTRYWERLRDDAEGEGGVHYLSALETQEIARDAERLGVEEARLTDRWQVVDESIEQHASEEIEAIRSGRERGKRTIARHTTQRPRPQMPFPWLLLLEYLSITLIVLVEVFQLTWPFLDFLGVDTSNLPAEWARNPIAVVGGVASAITATACLIFPWHLLVSSAVALSTGWETAGPLRAGLRLIGLFFLFVMLFTGTLFIANLRHGQAVSAGGFQAATLGQNAASHPGAGVFVFMTLLLPAGAAYLLHKIGESSYWQCRAAFQAQQATFDRDEDEYLQAGEARADATELLERKRARIGKQQALLLARRRALAGRVLTARQEWRETLDEARFWAETFMRSLRAALAMDRYYFLLVAYRCQALHLVPEEFHQLPEKPQCLSQPWTTAPRQFIRKLLSDGRNRDGY